MKNTVVVLLCAGLAACASAPRSRAPAVAPGPVVVPPPVASGCSGVSPYAPAQEDLSKRGDYVAGGLFRPGERDRVPGAVPDVTCIPEPQVVALPRSKLGNKPVYTVLDREYRVLDDTRGYTEEGLASYYGEKFHGRRTSNWEVYDMYAFSAAHKTLPLPSFARVTNLQNGRSVVVRVNDRGPFHEGRVMDLSLAAAVKLGIHPAGTGRVRVEALQPGDPATGSTFAQAAPPTGLDTVVAALPPAAPMPTAVPLPTPAANGHRFDMQQGGRTSTAGEFDAWMGQRGVRIATGRPAPVMAPSVASVDAPAPAAPQSVRAAPATAPAPVFVPVQAPAPIAAPGATGGIVLQLASFASRDNADRALATLRQAGIAEARLHDALSNGQPVWRLRVGPLTAEAEPALVARLAGLGFAAPRRVHD
ncbi:septal ring lytic transglycosylase RlpA family protein [Lysobacter humi (ex Lee et al. 2017)]